MENSGHGFSEGGEFKKFSLLKDHDTIATGSTEGSEPIKLTVRERGIAITCEVCKLNDAIHYADNIYHCCGCFTRRYNSIREQLKEERNKAIDDCIKIVKKRHYAMAFIKELESLKSDSK